MQAAGWITDCCLSKRLRSLNWCEATRAENLLAVVRSFFKGKDIPPHCYLCCCWCSLPHAAQHTPWKPRTCIQWKVDAGQGRHPPLNLSGNLSGLARWSHFFYSFSFLKMRFPQANGLWCLFWRRQILITCSICLKQRYIANRASHLGRTRHWRPPSTQSFLCERGTQNNTNSEPASKHIYLQHIYFPSTDCNSYTFGSGK